MKWLTRWFLDNPVAANLLMVAILALGALSLTTLRVESFPQTKPTSLVVSVTYPGGTARQVDEGITQRIEEAISDLAGIKQITSRSSEGLSTVRVKKRTDTNLERLIEDVRNRVNSIIGFPELAENPQIYRDEFSNLASFVVISGVRSDDELQPVARQLESALKRHPAISAVENWGKRSSQLVIEPDPDSLRHYGISFNKLASHIRQASLETRSGTIKNGQGKLLLRGDGYADTVRKLRKVVVKTTPTSEVLLEDIAQIRREYVKTDALVRNNGNNAIALLVSTSRKDNLLRVSEAIEEVLDKQRALLPDDIYLDTMADMAPYVEDQLARLGNNAWQGLLIVVVLLGLFLNLKLAFWVAVGIPVSIAGTLGVMGLPALDYSINDITLFGLILVLGILVDDAVVVGESIHQARGKYSDPKQAAGKGVEAVSVATVFGVLTTIAAFSPMLWIENELAKVLAGFSAVVILALLFSLVESKFILPAHLSSPPEREPKHWLSRNFKRLQQFCDKQLQRFTYKLYKPMLDYVIRYRYASLIGFISTLVLAYGLWFSGNIKSSLFPEIPGRYLSADISLEDGAPHELLALHAKQLESAASSLNNKIRDEFSLKESPITNLLVATNGSSNVEATVELTTEALSKLPNNYLLDAWKSASGRFEGAYAVKFTATDDWSGGTAISIRAPERRIAKQAAETLRHQLSNIPGVNDVYDNGQSGLPQLRFTLNRYGKHLGLTQSDLTNIISGAFGQYDIHRLLHQAEETKVVLQFSDDKRRSLQSVLDSPVFLPSGQYLTLGDIANTAYEQEPHTLFRRNRNEVITVYWRQDRSIQSPEAVWETVKLDILPTLNKQYPSAIVKPVGEFEEIGEVQAGFKKAMILTLLLIYTLLAIPLKSYWQPLIIMAVIPFGFAGAIFGHALMDLPISVLSLFGMMAMTGVVVNDSLILITRFNKNYRNGMPRHEALINTGTSRVRAIFLTTVTTVCGLLPLLSESSEQAQYLKPAAVSLVFGELFATSVTLLLIPILLRIFTRKDHCDTISDTQASQTLPNTTVHEG